MGRTSRYGLLALLPAVALVSGALMASPARAATFVYVGNTESNEIYVLQLAVGQLSHGLSSYRIDAVSGKLTQLKDYPMGKNPNWVEVVDLP